MCFGIQLEIVHILGTHMIDQKTNGLSQGIHLGGRWFKHLLEDETRWNSRLYRQQLPPLPGPGEALHLTPPVNIALLLLYAAPKLDCSTK